VDGIGACRRIRASSDADVVTVTARAKEADTCVLDAWTPPPTRPAIVLGPSRAALADGEPDRAPR
jgi:CheY-like chemotaxis protein